MIKTYSFNRFSEEENFKRNVFVSMQITKRGFCYFYYNEDNHEEFAIRSFDYRDVQKPNYSFIAETIEQLYKDNNVLKLKISYESEHFTLVPISFFDREQSQSLLDFNFGKIDSKIAFDNKIKHYGMYNVFSVDEKLLEVFPEKVLEKSFFADSTFFVKKALNYNDNSELKKLHLNLKFNKIDLCLTENKKVRFMNTFNCNTDNDIIYYILNVYEQDKMHVDCNKLILYGFDLSLLKISKRISKFIKNVEMEVVDFPITSLSSLNDLEQFEYLLSLQKCE